MKAPNIVLKNCKTALRSPYIEDWAGKQIAVYVEKGLKAFGGVHDVLRVRPVAPRVIIDLEPSKKLLNACKSYDELMKVFKAQSIAVQNSHAILGLCKTLAASFKEAK